MERAGDPSHAPLSLSGLANGPPRRRGAGGLSPAPYDVGNAGSETGVRRIRIALTSNAANNRRSKLRQITTTSAPYDSPRRGSFAAHRYRRKTAGPGFGSSFEDRLGVVEAGERRVPATNGLSDPSPDGGPIVTAAASTPTSSPSTSSSTVSFIARFFPSHPRAPQTPACSYRLTSASCE